MKYVIGFFVWTLLASGCLMEAQSSNTVQINESQPAKLRIDHDVFAKNKRILDIFMNVLRGTGVHGGFAEIATCSTEPKGDLKVSQGSTILEAMDALVAANPGYKWNVDDGVVNLIPRNGATLLYTSISSFQMDTTDLQAPSAIQDMLRLPEVQRREATLGLKPGAGQGGLEVVGKHPTPRQPAPVQIKVTNVSLREALNQIVASLPKEVWIYRETDCDGHKSFTVSTVQGY